LLMLSVKRSPELIRPDARQAIRRLVSGDDPWPLLMHGPAGGGKTCASLCLCDRCYADYETVRSLADRHISAQKGTLYYSGVTGGRCTPSDIWRDWSVHELTVLDEIGGRGVVSDHHYECVKEAIDARMGKPAIFISNHGPERLATLYDDRVTSRLAAGTVLELVDDDRRVSMSSTSGDHRL